MLADGRIQHTPEDEVSFI